MPTQAEGVPPAPSLVPHLHKLMQVTGAEVVFGGLAPHAEEPVVLDTLVGARSDGLRNLQLTAGFGLGGKVMQIGRPLHVRDYPSARGITHHYDQPVRAEQLRAILAVPIRSVTGVHGVIYAGMRRPTHIGDRMLDRAVAVARGIQFDICVEAEVQRRVTRWVVDEPGRSGVGQRLRDVHAELALIRNGAAGRTRQLIEDLMHRLSDTSSPTTVPALPARARGARLSARELDVITQAAAGHRNAQIGELLGLSEGTVKAYLFSASRKLGAKNRIEAVIAARRLGLIP